MTEHPTIKHTPIGRLLLFASIFLLSTVPHTGWAADTAGDARSKRLFRPAAEPPAPVAIQTAWSADRIRPGDTVVLAVVFSIDDGFHINADSGQLRPMEGFKPVPTRVTVTQASEDLRLETPQYPTAQAVKVAFAPDDLMSFEGRAIVYLPVTLDAAAAPEMIRLSLQAQYQACDARVCLFPQKVPVNVSLPVGAPAEEPVMANRPLFAGYRTAGQRASAGRIDFGLFGWYFSLSAGSWWGFAATLLVAGLGGFLLNLTPCVLPLIPIKIISLSNASQDASRCLALGLTMFLGVLGFWLALGAAIATVAGFTATNQLFQYPLFTISIGTIIAVMALGMCGLFSVRLPGAVYRIHPNQESLHGSFLLGILTAVLSTPCTAPFMGAAAAWAATRHPLTTLATFASIGIGMALPYLVLSAFPGLVRNMPKTGPTSVLIKQVMGMFMLAAAAYFIGTGVSGMLADPPNPPARTFWWAVMLFAGAGGGWLAFRTVQIAAARWSRFVFTALGLLVVAGSILGGLRLTDKGPVDWVNFTPQRFQQAVDNQQVVVLLFTAEWCLNCKAMEQAVLNSRTVASLFKSADVVPMKADITGNNVYGKEKMRQLGHLTIPLLVVYARGGEEIFRSDFYTVEQIVETVSRARAGGSGKRAAAAG